MEILEKLTTKMSSSGHNQPLGAKFGLLALLAMKRSCRETTLERVTQSTGHFTLDQDIKGYKEQLVQDQTKYPGDV